MSNSEVGIFEAIDSFIIRERKEFYLIGDLKSGQVEVGWFLNIVCNSSFWIPAKINRIEQIEFLHREEKYTLLVASCEDDEHLDLLLSLNVGLEEVKITKTGPKE